MANIWLKLDEVEEGSSLRTPVYGLMEYVQLYRTVFLIHRKNPTPQNKRVLKAAARDVLKFIEMEM